MTRSTTLFLLGKGDQEWAEYTGAMGYVTRNPFYDGLAGSDMSVAVDSQGNILGDRVLYHPHVDEQPFTRSLNNVDIPKGIKSVYIEAHDKVHGWTTNRLKIDLEKSQNGHIRVRAD